MRCRNIKPGFFLNPQLAEKDFHERLLFIGLWCLADAEGRVEDNPKKIKAQIFPYDEDAVVQVDRALDSLAPEFILRYEADGCKCIQIKTFKKHQVLSGNERKSRSVWPSPEKAGLVMTKHDSSGNGAISHADEGRRTKDEGSSSPSARAREEGELPEPWGGWLARVRGAHPCCREIGAFALTGAVRKWGATPAQTEEAIAAFERHMSGAASHPNPVQKFENYIRRAVGGADGADPEEGADAAPASREVFQPRGWNGKKEKEAVAAAEAVTGRDTTGAAQTA